MICYIPTKGRFNTKTYQLFESVGIEFLHFVEPSELESYDVPNKVSIEKDNGGIGYVRNFMLNYARENNHDWILVCDDDVTSFGVYNGKTVKKDASIWLEIKQKAEKLPFEIVGINYTQHAWHEKTSYSINKKFAEVCVLFNVKRIKWDYRVEFNMKEDRDFCLQAVKYGAGVLRFNHYWFSCPDVGSNKGGLNEQYQSKADEQAAVKMCEEWNPFVTLKRKGDRVDMKAKMKELAKFHKKAVR